MKYLVIITAVLQITICNTSKADNAFHPRNNSEFILYLPDLQKSFEDIAKSPNKCSLESYRKMESILREAFVWYNFSHAIDRLQLINGLLKSMQVGELPEFIYTDNEDLGIKQAIQELNMWYDRECSTNRDKIDLKNLKRDLALVKVERD